MRIGILFGGKSREREISFAGGRTVYDMLDKSLFEPVPVFIDRFGNFIVLDWQYLYKGSIRDFYPVISTYTNKDYIPDNRELDEVFARIGKKVQPEDLKYLIDFAFLALHGPYGEDGSIQGILDFYDIPYSGSGIMPSAIGINKVMQKQLMNDMGIKAARSESISRSKWLKGHEEQRQFYEIVRQKFQLPLVIKSSTQGSSIGVSILKDWDFERFLEAANKSFFIREVKASNWLSLNSTEKNQFVKDTFWDLQGESNVQFTIGDIVIFNERNLESYLDIFSKDHETVTLISLQSEPEILVEEFIEGEEFSCIVVEGKNGEPIALPPTEIIKQSAIFDYRAKYLPGIARKITPIRLPEKKIGEIIAACENLYTKLHFDVYARIDGLINNEGHIYLNDPNTTSGMLPSSFFFHQAAEIGLSPTQFLTYIIHKSFEKRLQSFHKVHIINHLLAQLDKSIESKDIASTKKMNIAVIFGGYSSERHISVESGRNVFEKLSSSGKYNAIPVFLSRNEEGGFDFYILPMSLLLKDNADDIRDKCSHFEIAPVIRQIIEKADYITNTFSSSGYEFYPRKITMDELAETVDFVFLGLHGRPGEDGHLQRILDEKNIPYNGSGTESSAITIDKYLTNEILMENGFMVPKHFLVRKESWVENAHRLIEEIESNIPYPLIAKPSDDGCSSAVKKIKGRDELLVFMEAMFRDMEDLPAIMSENLGLKTNEEFPYKNYFVVEELIEQEDSKHFIEITCGLLTKYDANNDLVYEIFEPSEALAQKGILSLEEKFLAGEGQNITPARFDRDVNLNKEISSIVRLEIEKAARLLNIEGYSRIDAFVRIFEGNRVEVIFIEVNSLPGLTPATVIFHQAALNGYKPFEFLDHIIQFGLAKSKKREYNTAN